MDPNREITKTQLAKQLYRSLRENNSIDIMFTGLWGNIWVSDHNKAYRVRDLGFHHLSNIVTKYRKRGQQVPQMIWDEYDKKLKEYRKDKEGTTNEQV